MAIKQDIYGGMFVHFTQALGAHSVAAVINVVDADNNIVDLYVYRADHSIYEQYVAHAVHYSETLEAGTWHFIEGNKIWKKA